MSTMNACQGCLLATVIAAVSVLSARGDSGTEPVAQGRSGLFLVDTRGGADRFAQETDAVTYGPTYSFRQADDASYVVLRKVEHAGTPQAVTSVVQTCSAGAEGSYVFSLGAADARTLRLIHSTYDAKSKLIGEELVADVAFAYTGCASDVVLDSRPDSLQKVAEAGGPAPLAYSTDWVTNGVPASVRLTCVCDRSRKGELIESLTNVLLTADAPVTGVYPHAIDAGNGGTFTLTCSFLDAQGELLGDSLSASYYFKEKWGMLLFLK